MKQIRGIMCLLFKCMCVTAPLWGAAIFCSTHLLSIVGEGYVGQKWNRDFTNTTHEKQYNVVILGDSLANASYIPEVLSESTINLALPGSGTVDGYYTLLDYLEHNPAPKDIFVTYMDYHLQENYILWDVGNYIHKYDEKQNQEIFDALNTYAIEDVEKLTAKDYWKEVRHYRYYSPAKYSHALVYSVIENRKERNEKLYEEISARYGRYSSITNEEYDSNADVGYTSFSVSPFNEYYYEKILELCYENDIFVHLIKLPLPETTEYTKYYSTDIWDYYIDFMSGHHKSDFRWFHSRYGVEYFKDQYHLNNHGAFRFSRSLKETYPEVFKDSSKCSPERMLALDKDVEGENILSELVKWIDGKPFTIVFLDNNVNLKENYYMCIGWSEDRDVDQLHVKNASTMDSVYYLTADGSNFSKDISVEEVADGAFQITLSSGESCILEPTVDTGICFAVIDNVNNTIVCKRQSLFEDMKFSKIQ